MAGVGRPTVRQETVVARDGLPESVAPVVADDLLVELAVVGRPHGIRGELKLRLHWEGSTTLFEQKTIQLKLARGDSLVFAVELARWSGKSVLLRFAGVGSRDQADLLKGARVLVPRAALPALGDDEYYLIDVVGAKVEGPDGPLGVVVKVQTHPSVDTVIIRTPKGRLLEQVLSPPWVERVELEGERRIVLSSLDGMI